MRSGSKILLYGVMACTSACGQPADADANQTTDRSSTSSAPVVAARSGVKATALPIEQGIYADVLEEGCARASRVFFYDGSKYGLIRQADQTDGTPASMDAYQVQRVGSFTPDDIPYDHNIRDFQGFAKVWSTEIGHPDEYGEIDVEYVGIKVTGNGSFIKLTGGTAIGIGRHLRGDETYQKCAFSQLSSRMQATIRAQRPQLAGGTTPSQPLASAPTKFPPVPKGYYAVGTTCARAASTQAASDGPSSLVRFDEHALTWFDGGPEIRAFESIGSNRFRVRAKSYGNGDDSKGASADFVIRITSASSFVTEPGSALFDKQEAYPIAPPTRCPKPCVIGLRADFATKVAGNQLFVLTP